MVSSAIRKRAANLSKAKRAALPALKPRGTGDVKRTPKFELEHTQMFDEYFIVDHVVAERLTNKDDGKKYPEFFIKWLGYADKYNTWEPLSNLAGLKNDIAQFRKDKAAALDAERVRREEELVTKTQVDADAGVSAAQETVEFDADADTFRPAKRGRRTASCWDFYSEKCDVPGYTAFYAHSANTTNVWTHLSKARKDECCLAIRADQGSEGPSDPDGDGGDGDSANNAVQADMKAYGPNLGTRGNIFFNHGCNKNPTVSLELKHEELAPSVRKGREALHTDYCKRYFEDLPLTELEDLCVATMLDPRFKNFDFEGMARFDSGKLTRERSVAWLRAAWIADWKVKEVETVGKKVEEKEQHVVGAFMQRRLKSVPMQAVQIPVDRDELDQYLALPQEDHLDPAFDLLAYWRRQSAVVPNVARMARQFLAPPATTAGVERVFSRVGRMHGDLQKAVARDFEALSESGGETVSV
ncbi:hypothetical protein CYMTET_7877 [Cymbomonas tetramitiformis]|uniref:Chromo domain-containing protein n=1 Tax=Cymbomonas tetramitiformis TaxID=36881 RepID=A0AAE0GUM7_9CHLO|nr:hypothetical protein CYMTET_7877 [Cymbomonas tetramitiformis]